MGNRYGNDSVTHLILHIGHPKTGTTALQTVLSANADRLLKAGVLYPSKARPLFHNHALAKPALTGRDDHVIRRRHGLEGEALRRLSERYWTAVKAEAQAHPHETIVLSWEWFWDAGTARAEGFRHRLSDICDKVTVVGYLRDPARLFLSWMNQKSRGFQEISLFPADYYRSVAEAYRTNGFEAVSMNAFESSQLAMGDIVADFCGKYLPETVPALERGTAAERSNESVSNEAAALLQEMSAAYGTASPDRKDPLRGKIVRILREADRALGGTLKPSLKPRIADALVARAADLIWLRDEAGIRFTDVDYGLVGTTGHPDLASLRRVADFSSVDPERLAALRAMTEPTIAQIHRPDSAVRSIFRRWVGGFAR